ncbi:hypothetical protein GZ427_004843 [Salmonella enterica]|uniref:DUF4102 domain-containing protein n=2 Tax=Gammaproteobacteria TaxID=1236 RepID=A0A6Y6N0T6_SALER|nr:hypothetical protein [Vibrio alginolyticus]AWU84338.1 hypothetical protein DNA64_24280 [Salmonella enterica subsp. enterica serovar Anatum]AXS22497.1 hypothetical protein D0887_28970 [Klebsiella pneumoniae]EAM4978666.1 hypothetical protein [Salmonella enterica]MBE8816901.1 hypothetical protein [Serratia marcescens]MDJ1229381.1 hypothetical protein [Escherichia coli]HBX3629635.1 hypothetical protein [Klebsiella pneumoniae subsp. pneumoniae]
MSHALINHEKSRLTPDEHTRSESNGVILGVVSENGIYGHSRFCNTDFDDKLACLNLSGV